MIQSYGIRRLVVASSSLLLFLGTSTQAFAQDAAQPSLQQLAEASLSLQSPQDAGPPVPITLQDAISRAARNDATYLSSVTDAKVAHEDQVQARAALLPSLSYTQQYLGTQGNGITPNGRYVSNDGVHLYRVWGVVHQEMPAGFFTLSPYRRAKAGAALAQAKAEIARRGLTVTVTRAFYGLLVAQRKYATAQQVSNEAQRFFDLTTKLEGAGEVAHSDTIKARLQLDQQTQAFREAKLAMEDAHLALAVLLSPTLDQHYTAIDNLDELPSLPPFGEVQTMAAKANPNLRVAMEALRQAKADVSIARAGFFPTLSLDGDYGIEANALALHSRVAAAPQLGPLPNLGYFITATLNMPVWNWGATLSKLHQAQYRHQQAQVELSQTQRETLANLYSFYNGAAVSRAQLANLREAADLAGESMRLTTLRYQAGDATALEVVDAQNTLASALNSLSDGQARYRVALATLQGLTGPF